MAIQPEEGTGMRTIIVCCAVLTAFLGVALRSGPAFAFRCGERLVSVGDTRDEVKDKCGEPSSVEAWQEERIKRDFYRPGIDEAPGDYEGYRVPLLVKEQVRIEEWQYNLGPRRLTRYLRFENGRLIKMTTGDYGR
jgi:hypothetical protein